MYMNKYIKLLSLTMTLILAMLLCACASTPEYTIGDIINLGKKTFEITPESNRTFSIQIAQQSGSKYIIDGRTADGRTAITLTVLNKGLKSKYSNIAVIEGQTLYIGMNNMMTATEDQLGFRFSESASLQGKYLAIPDGYAKLLDVLAAYETATFGELNTLRTNTTATGGTINPSYEYTQEAFATAIDSAINKTAYNADTLTAKCDDALKALAGDKVPVLTDILKYTQGCIDVDTLKEVSTYKTAGTLVCSLIQSELGKIKEIANTPEATIVETFEWLDDTQTYSHNLTIKKGEDELWSVNVFSNATETPNENKIALDQTVDIATFLDTMLINAKNASGIGYESDDFPYGVEYTSSSLTLTEETSTYKAIHNFSFQDGRFVKYTITFETYELYLHTALVHKYTQLGYIVRVDESKGLAASASAGAIQVETTSLSRQYDLEGPLELLSSLRKVGIPTYAQFNQSYILY